MIIEILKTSGFTAILSAVVAYVTAYNRARTVDKMLMLQAFKNEAWHAIGNKCISLKDLECIEAYYKLYKDLKGDGFADSLMTKVRQLPICND